MSISVKRPNFILVLFKAVCYAKARAERNFAGSSSYISIYLHIFLKFLNTSANNSVPIWTCKSWYSP